MVSGLSSDGGTAPLVQAGLLDALVSAFDSERFPEHADVVGHACRVVRCLGTVPGLEMVLFERGLGAAAVNALRRHATDEMVADHGA